MSLKLYSPQNYATAGAKVELFLRFVQIPVEFERIPWDQWKSPEYLKKHPLGKVPTLETPEGCIFESAAILRYLARKAGKLYGNTPAETANIDQWLEFINTQVNPNNMRTIYGNLGYVQVAKDQYEAGKKDFLDVLRIVDAQLKKTSYLAGNEISIADIALIGGVRLALRLIFDEKARSAIPNVVQWYERLFTHQEVSGFFGRPWLCTKELLPEFPQEAKKEEKKADKKEDKKEKKEEKKEKKEEKKEEKAEKKEEKKEEKKAEKGEKKEKEPKKKEEKKAAEPKKAEPKKEKKKKESEDEVDEPVFPVEKQKNPLDSLPKSPFNIDDWKREFCNAPDKLAVLQSTWEKFDHDGWSLWRLHYIRYDGEGKVDYLTNNLKNGYLRNIDHFRKYTFGVLGVYGVEGDYEIDGIWLWRGTEIPNEWKEHPSYEYFTFNKLDPRDAAVQKLTADYWLNLNEGDLVEGKPVYESKWFK